MMRNLGPEQEDRGVEGGYRDIEVDGRIVRRKVPPAVDGLGNPAAPEVDVGGD